MRSLITAAVLCVVSTTSFAQSPESRPATTGSVRITVTWKGEAPASRPAAIPKEWKSRNPDDAKVCDSCADSGVLIDETLIVDAATKGIRNVVVAVTPAKDGTADTGAPISEKPVMANKGCRFEPHVVLATPSSPLTITNEDPFTHAASIATLRGASLTSEVVQPNGKTEVGKLAARGIYVVSCPLHGWMRGYVVVLKQGPAGITDTRGTTLLDGVAPGPRTLTVWHETLGANRVEAVVKAGAITEVTITQDDFPAKPTK